jgi:hypothetical protein
MRGYHHKIERKSETSLKFVGKLKLEGNLIAWYSKYRDYDSLLGGRVFLYFFDL